MPVTNDCMTYVVKTIERSASHTCR